MNKIKKKVIRLKHPNSATSNCAQIQSKNANALTVYTYSQQPRTVTLLNHECGTERAESNLLSFNGHEECLFFMHRSVVRHLA